MKKILFTLSMFLVVHGAIQAQSKEEKGNITFKEFTDKPKYSVSNAINLINESTQGRYKKGTWLFTERLVDEEVGMEHYSFQLYYENKPVLHHIYKVHVKNSTIYSISGEGLASLPAFSNFVISDSLALSKAMVAVGAEKYMWQNSKAEKHLKLEQGKLSATFYPTAEQMFLSVANELQPVYRFDIYAEQPLGRYYVFVNAMNGEVIHKQNRICHTTVTGTAVTKYSGQQSFQTYQLSNGTYRLQDNSRGNGIVTWDLGTSTSHFNAVHFFDSDNYWNNFNFSQDEVATDAHWGAQRMYDYLWNEHNRNSLDNIGFALNSYVHYGVGFANAFWDGSRMTYGDGDWNMDALTTLDICGHEITHGLTERTADLVYQNESGALNESFSDIFGVALEYYSKPSASNWQIGDETGNAIRSLSNPGLFGDPDCYLGNNYYLGSLDYGGVHTNSGVQNYWFYLLVNGGSGVNDLGNSYSVSGIGREKAEKIAFRNLTVYLTPNSNYYDARTYAIQSAIDLYGACSNEVTQTANAWYAVGVGSVYSATVDANFDASNKEGCNAPHTVNFLNQSSHGGSFVWDFGDGSTSTDVSPSHTYLTNGSYTVKLTADGGSCGVDSVQKQNFVFIDPSGTCEYVMTPGTNPTQTSCNGVILDAGGDFDYANNAYDQIVIQPANALNFTITFSQFDIEASGTSCSYDALYIYDGVGTASSLIGKYCNSNPPPSSIFINNASGAATILLTTDGSVTHSGFKLHYSCTPATIPPVADFVSSVKETCTGEVAFYDESEYAPHTWHWDFGDGDTSNLQNPEHFYTNSGIYNVKLIATNDYGVDSLVKNQWITVSLPQSSAIVKLSGYGSNGDTLIAAGNHNNTYWYADVHSSYIHQGDTFIVPMTLQDSSIFMRNGISGSSVYGGLGHNLSSGNYYGWNCGMYFTVTNNLRLKSIKTFAQGAGDRNFIIADMFNNQLLNEVYTLPDGESDVQLDVDLVPGDYYIMANYSYMVDLYNTFAGISYPYAVGNDLTITSGFGGNTEYHGFYNWEVVGAECLSEIKEVDVNLTTGVDALVDGKVKVYPNPVKNVVNVSTDNLEEYTISVINVAGQTVYESNNVMGSLQINVSEWAKGVYLMKVNSKQITETLKLIVE